MKWKSRAAARERVKGWLGRRKSAAEVAGAAGQLSAVTAAQSALALAAAEAAAERAAARARDRAFRRTFRGIHRAADRRALRLAGEQHAREEFDRKVGNR